MSTSQKILIRSALIAFVCTTIVSYFHSSYNLFDGTWWILFLIGTVALNSGAKKGFKDPIFGKWWKF